MGSKKNEYWVPSPLIDDRTSCNLYGNVLGIVYALRTYRRRNNFVAFEPVGSLVFAHQKNTSIDLLCRFASEIICCVGGWRLESNRDRL